MPLRHPSSHPTPPHPTHLCADPDPVASDHAEADAFFCFVDLMGEFRDHFCQQLVREAAMGK